MPKKYIINDTKIETDNRLYDLDWNQHLGIERHKQFIYRICYSVKYSKLATNLQEIDNVYSPELLT